jgi:predicted RNA methylase
MTVVKSRFPAKENNLYETEAWTTLALLRRFPLRGRRVWEPAAGNHAMVDVLRAHGARVFASDIETYSRRHHRIFDFLSEERTPRQFDAVVTNPPFGPSNRLAVRFIERALDRCDGLVAMLLTAKFDSGSTRYHLFRDNPRFLAKIVLTDRIQWFEGEYGGTEDHCWMIWGPAPGVGGMPSIYYEGKEPR